MNEPLPCYPNVLTVREIQQILRISSTKAYELVHSHVFPSIKIGRDFRIPKDSFWEWVRRAGEYSGRALPPMSAAQCSTSVDPSSILFKLLNGG